MPGLVQQKAGQNQRLEIFHRQQQCEQVVTYQSTYRSLSLPSFEGCTVFLSRKCLKSTRFWSVSLVLVVSVPVGITSLILPLTIWVERFYWFHSIPAKLYGKSYLAWWNMFITKLLMRIRLGPSFPAHHHQYSQLALVKKRHVTSSQWCIPASSPGSSGAEQTWSHTEMTMCDEKSYKGLFSNVPLVQSELAELRKQKEAVFMVLGWLLCFPARQLMETFPTKANRPRGQQSGPQR